MTKLLVTGASGFIASHTIIELLEHGYQVRGTIRDLAKADAVKATIAKHSLFTDKLEIVAATLTDKDCWDAAVEGCDGVIHIASPVPIEQPADANEIIIPARDGALNVLTAAHKAGIKRVVMTSSVAAVQYNDKGDSAPQTAEDWTDIENPLANAYALSKTYAEKAAWDFMADHSDMELVTIQPALVLGPALEADYGSSLESILVLLDGKYPRLPHISFGIVDVRDVASLHRLAYEVPEAAGQRLLCSNGVRWFLEISNHLASVLPAYRKKLPSKEFPNWVIRFLAIFDPVIAFVVKGLDMETQYDTSPALALGWKPRSAEEAIEAGGKSLVDLGLV